MKRIRKVVVHITEKTVPAIEQDFTRIVVDGITYFDSKKDMTHREALDLAAKHGLRVMEPWEMNKLFIESEEFRKSLADKWYWCASVNSDSRYYAWRFNGYYGYVDYNPRDYVHGGVRCVGLP
jgi:hypothetical protein